EYQRQNYI
ncbi:unnamed protein product, partial [Rotaria sp. Silwood2]